MAPQAGGTCPPSLQSPVALPAATASWLCLATEAGEELVLWPSWHPDVPSLAATTRFRVSSAGGRPPGQCGQSPAGLAHSPPGPSLSDDQPLSSQPSNPNLGCSGHTDWGFSQTLYNDLEASGLEFPSPWWLFTPSMTLSSATPFSLQALDGSSCPGAAPTFLSGVILSLERPGVGLYSL